jgi:subtilisin family serine protease
MSVLQRLASPFGRPRGPYNLPGRLIVRMRLGEAPSHIPSLTDVEAGAAQPASGIDGGPVDRLVRHFSSSRQVTRVHSSAAEAGRVGQRNRNFDQDEHRTGLSHIFRFDVDQDCPVADLADALRGVATVKYAGLDYAASSPFVVAAPLSGVELEGGWGSRDQIRASQAIAHAKGDPAVIVALVDSGVQFEHPELRTRLRRGVDLVRLIESDVASGVRLLSAPHQRGAPPEDNVGHGTSCAAIIAGEGDRMPPGLAAGCGQIPIRVLTGAILPGRPQPVGIGSLVDIDRGLKVAMDLGADVLNMSFGTPQSALDANDPVPHEEVVRYGALRGCVMVAASGNSGQEEYFTPACLDGVIAVGACRADDTPAPFSTRGDHVALLAPGVRVLSATLKGQYGMVTGTSFAAPFVAATAALLLSQARKDAYPLEAAGVLRLLTGSARPLRAGTETGHGAGVLDAFGALVALDREIDSGLGSSP